MRISILDDGSLPLSLDEKQGILDAVEFVVAGRVPIEVVSALSPNPSTITRVTKRVNAAISRVEALLERELY